jgi:hypothetical protein
LVQARRLFAKATQGLNTTSERDVVDAYEYLFTCDGGFRTMSAWKEWGYWKSDHKKGKEVEILNTSEGGLLEGKARTQRL